MPYCDANSDCDNPSFERSARTSTGSGTLTIRTGSDISPRANAATSFNPEMMSRATRERVARLVGAPDTLHLRLDPEALDDLADFLFVGIRQILLFVLCIHGDENDRVRTHPKVIDQPHATGLSHPRPRPPGLADALRSGHHRVTLWIGGDGVFHLRAV